MARHTKLKAPRGKTTEGKSKFSVPVQDWAQAIKRINAVMEVGDVKLENRTIRVVADAQENIVYLESGFHDVYVKTTLYGADVAASGVWTSNITIPDIRYGGKTVEFEVTLDDNPNGYGNVINYRSRLKGFFHTSGFADTVIRNTPGTKVRPLPPKSAWVKLPATLLKQAFDEVWFKTEPLDGMGLSTALLQLSLPKGYMEMSLHDHHRGSLTSVKSTSQKGSLNTIYFPVDLLKVFLALMDAKTTNVSISQHQNGVWLQTPEYFAVVPGIETGSIQDLKKLLNGLMATPSLFSFDIEGGKFHASLTSLLSSQGASSKIFDYGKKANRVTLSVLRNQVSASVEGIGNSSAVIDLEATKFTKTKKSISVMVDGKNLCDFIRLAYVSAGKDADLLKVLVWQNAVVIQSSGALKITSTLA